MNHFAQSIKRPFTNFWRLVVGIILSIVPIVNLLATGYQLRCAKTAMAKKFEMPKWEGFGNLFVSGLLAAIISAIFVIPAIIVFSLIAAKSLSELITNIISQAEFSIFDFFTGANINLLILGIALLVIGSYVGLSAIIKYSERLRFSDAFTSGVFKKAFTGKYFVTWIVMIIYVGVITAMIGLIPFVGGSIASFIGAVSYMTALGSIYKKL